MVNRGTIRSGLKAPSDRLIPLYETFGIPRAATNRFCIGAAAFTLGGSAADSDHTLGEQ